MNFSDQACRDIVCFLLTLLSSWCLFQKPPEPLTPFCLYFHFIPSSHLQDILCHHSVVLMRAHRRNLLFQCLAAEKSTSQQGTLKHLVHWEHRVYKTQTRHQQQSVLFSVSK